MSSLLALLCLGGLPLLVDAGVAFILQSRQGPKDGGHGVGKIFHSPSQKKAPGNQHWKLKVDELPLSSLVLFVPIRVEELFAFFVCGSPFLLTM